MVIVTVPDRVLINDKGWAICHQSTFAGADTFQTIWGSPLAPARAYADVLVIDGVGVIVHQAAGINYQVYVYQSTGPALNDAVQQNLWAAASAATLHGDCKTGLMMPTREIEAHGLIHTNATVALNDYIYASAWGHYLPTGEIPEPAPVSVQEFHLFRPRKVSGPV